MIGSAIRTATFPVPEPALPKNPAPPRAFLHPGAALRRVIARSQRRPGIGTGARRSRRQARLVGVVLRRVPAEPGAEYGGCLLEPPPRRHESSRRPPRAPGPRVPAPVP